MADYPGDAKRSEILEMIRKAAGDHDAGPPTKPLKAGYEYRLKKPLIGNGLGE
jgi:hypothetical protein